MKRDVTLLITAMAFLSIGAVAGHFEGLSKGYERILGDMQTRVVVK